MKKNRWIALAAAVMTAAAALPALPVQAADPVQIVVIGDNVAYAAGKGSQVYAENGGLSDAVYTYFTTDNAHTEDVLAVLEEDAAKTALQNADYVIFSAGMYDVLDPYIEKANEYRVQFGFQYFSDIFGAHMSDFGIKSEDELKDYCNTLGSCARLNKKTASPNVRSISEKIKEATNGKIIAVNCYNPMDTIEQYDSLSEKRQLAYGTATNPVMGQLRDKINVVYAEMANEGIAVIDAYSAFEGKAYIYSHPDELQPAPSFEGSLLLGQLVGKEMNIAADTLPDAILGDVNGDQTVNASDAAVVLIHAADIGAGGSGTLNALQTLTGNVSRDIPVNATDAARILIFAAMQGAEGNADFGRIG